MQVRGSRSRFVIGVDLGQKHNYSALALLERIELEYNERDAVTYDFKREVRYRLRDVGRVRLGTPYPEVQDEVRRWVKLAGSPCTVVVDGTGVGGPVVEMMRRNGMGCRVVPVTITGGDREGSDGTTYRVPKLDLMSGLQVMVEKNLVTIADGGGAVDALLQELLGMRAQGRRVSGKSDDLVLALALAWWWVRKGVNQW